jgi:alkylated DNA repair dioxygenase AlkB
MDLFSTELDENQNLLPKDGTVLYYGHIMPLQEANFYLQNLLETIAWKNDQAIIFGKLIITKRKVAWYGDTNFNYTYSNTTKQALIWTPELLKLKKLV